MSRENYELTGQKIQGYTISKPIGQGKFSIVYRAENQQGIPFALKKIKIFDMADQKQRDKCLREVDIMKKLSHPHIIQYIDSFIHNNELIIVTEWAQKGDLKQLIRQKEASDLQLEEHNIWDFMRQIASALCHMHEKRIMHRDLKPANIFIGADEKLKVGDLGLGRSFSSETLEAYSKVGTPLYMSPELIQDEGYTENADVWSLGCICYELAELKSPFRNKEQKMSLMDLFDNITKCNYRPIDSRFSPQLRQAIKNMIVVDPLKRWSSQQVHTYALKCMQDVRKPLLDPIIAMDDISIKLTLLNYQTFFCKVAERKPIHKLYFALPETTGEPNGQLFYFLQLAYWIMALSKPDAKKDRLALYSKVQVERSSPQSACRKFKQDLQKYGLKLQNNNYLDGLLDGHGQSVCYLLNQLLTRQLIRLNFQFKPPNNDNKNKTSDEFIDQTAKSHENSARDDIQEEERARQEESLQEQSVFEQSIFFNKNNRRGGMVDGALIDKIQELEQQENKMMIVGRIDEQQWRAQCLRLQKKLGEINTSAKQARKKYSHANIQTSKLSSAKLTDLTKYVRHNVPLLSRSIQHQLEIIHLGQNRINSSYSGIAQNYQQNNQQSIQLAARANTLSEYIKQRSAVLDKTQQKLVQVQEKINMATASNENSRVGELRTAIKRMKDEIMQMDQRKEMISWELRRAMMRNRDGGKEEYIEVKYLEEL